MKARIAAWVSVALVVACSEDGGKPMASTGGEAGQSGSADSAGESGMSGGNGASGATEGDGVNGGNASGGDVGNAGASGEVVAGEPVALPPGSREVSGVVNLVDADAAQELETFLTVEQPVFITRRHDLARSFNLFVESYLEEYDFIFFYTDHWVEGAYAAGIHQAVNRRAEPGGTSEFEIALGGYRTDGRTRAVLAMNYDVGFYGPMAHEIMHQWGANLDDRFGFGAALDQDYGAHWGFSSVNGQLGGFDGSTLRCQTPADSAPPCKKLANGRTRYVVGDFAPSTNVYRGVPYSPLELYLAGLAPATEVPEEFQVLTEAAVVNPEAVGTGQDIVVEASGIKTVTFAEIQARHGRKALLPTKDRAFRAAFVVISETPASDEVMEDVARIAAVFGNRETFANWESFETIASGRATLDTRLGQRRDTATPPPAERELFECDAVAQDCGRPELGCHIWPPAFCALSGSVPLDQPCDAAFECAPGLDCVSSAAAPTVYVCKPYCDPTDNMSPKACTTLCPGSFAQYLSEAGDSIGGLCYPD
jgi:hypothetical protein